MSVRRVGAPVWTKRRECPDLVIDSSIEVTLSPRRTLMTAANQVSPGVGTRRRGKRRRSEIERLLDLTVLGPTTPELGTCWLFTGTCSPYGRMAKAQDTYTHRLRLEASPRPDPSGQGAASPLWRVRLPEP